MATLDDYKSFMLRLWSMSEPDSPGADWQGEIQHIQTGQCWTFATLDALLDLLREQNSEIASVCSHNVATLASPIPETSGQLRNSYLYPSTATFHTRRSGMTQTTSVPSAIDRTNRAFEDAFRKRDAAGCATVYTTDGSALPPNGETVKGRESLRQLWQGAMDMGIADATLETVEFEQHGDTAWEVGKAILKDEKGTVIDEAKFIVIWKRENDEWKWHRDIWNSSRALE